MPEKSRNFSSNSNCVQMLGSSENVVCSNNGDLLRWDVFSGSLLKVFLDAATKINNIDTVSSTFPSLIIVEDSTSNIKIVDMDYGTQNLSVSAYNFIKIKDELLAFQTTTYLIQIYNMTTFAKVYEISLNLDQGFYIEVGNYIGILGNKNNEIIFWNFQNSKTSNIIANFTFNVVDMYVINNTYIIMIGADTSIFNFDPNTSEKTLIESASNSPQIFHYDQNVILINSFTSYFYNVSSQNVMKTLPISSMINYFSISNLTAFTIQNDLQMNKWDFSTCEPLAIFQNPLYNISFSFDMGEDSTRVGILNTGNQIMILNLLTNKLSQYSYSGLSDSYCTQIVKIPYFNQDDILILACYKKLTPSIFNIILVNLNSNQFTNVPIGDFNCSLNSLIYMEMEDYVAFECGGQIYIFSILHYYLISSWNHTQSVFNGLFTLKNSPNNIGSTSSMDIRIWDVFTGILQIEIISTNYFCLGCVSLNSSFNLISCFHKHSLNNTSSIKIWSLQNSTLIYEIKDPVFNQSTSFSYQQMKAVQIDQNYLMVASNQKIDLWELANYSLTKSLMINRFSQNLLQLLSSQTLIFDFSSTSFMLWDFSQTSHQNVSCISNFYYNSSAQTCEKCGSSCQSSQYCTQSSPNTCLYPQCSYFFSKNKYPSYTSCLHNNQLNNIFIDSNEICINCTNVTDICYSELCFTCQDGFYYQGMYCFACDKSCSTCFAQGPSSCLSCSDSNSELNDNYTCVQKATNVKLILIIIFSIFGGFLVMMLWLYLYRQHQNIYKELLKNEILSAKTAHLEVKIHENEQLFSEVNTNEDYLIFVTKNCGELLTKIKNQTPSEKAKIFHNFLNNLQKNIPKKCFQLKNSKEHYENFTDVVELELINVGSNGPVYIVESQIKQKFIWKVMINGEENVNEEKIEFLIEIAKEQFDFKQFHIGTGCQIEGIGISFEGKSGSCGFVHEYFEFNLCNFILKFQDNIEMKLLLALCLLKQVKELSNLKYSHGNLKSFNVLINYTEGQPNNLHIALADARKYHSFDKLLKSIRLADKHKLRFLYIAPEFFFQNEKFEFNERSDIWSLGVLLFEIFYNDVDLYKMTIPWGDCSKDLEKLNDHTEEFKDADNFEEVRKIIAKEKNLKMINEFCLKDSQIPPEITDSINACLQIRSENRLSLSELIQRIQKIEMLLPKGSKKF